jgi:diphosphoinositol-polyphosphate diphosphatase
MPHTLPKGPQPPLASRSGRQTQRFSESGDRLVAGCIPIRLKPGTSAPEGIEVLLITSRSGKGFVFPKGGWEQDEVVEKAARRETVEEAGVRGDLELPAIGTFPFLSSKYSTVTCTAHMYALMVTEVLEDWPEKGARTRGWYTIEDAHRMLRHDWMRRCLETWVNTHGWSDVVPKIEGGKEGGKETPGDQFAAIRPTTVSEGSSIHTNGVKVKS